MEKISIKELSELAEISKATFYLHYKDIFDLSDSLQNEVIQNILEGIAHPEYFITDHAKFTYELFHSFYAQRELTDILFSGNQSAVLPMRIDQELRDYIHKQFPEVDREVDMRLTYQVLGSFYVFNQYYHEYGMEETLQFVVEISNTLAQQNNPRRKNNV